MNDRQFASALRDVCSELSKRIATHSAEQDRLTKLKAALEELLEIYERGRNREGARTRPAQRERAGNARAALDLLRAAEHPLTTREIAEAILTQRGWSRDDSDALRRIIPSIAVALRRHARKGLVDDGGSFPAQWRIVEKPSDNG